MQCNMGDCQHRRFCPHFNYPPTRLEMLIWRGTLCACSAVLQHWVVGVASAKAGTRGMAPRAGQPAQVERRHRPPYHGSHHRAGIPAPAARTCKLPAQAVSLRGQGCGAGCGIQPLHKATAEALAPRPEKPAPERASCFSVRQRACASQCRNECRSGSRSG